MALRFTASADFAFDKAPREPCQHLQTDFRCDIHDRLTEHGMRGCVSFDCFGAGQRIAQVSFGGRDWRTHPESSAEMFQGFVEMRILHELLWYLREALGWSAAAELRPTLHEAAEETERLAAGIRGEVYVATHRAKIAPLLRQASELVRAPAGLSHADTDLAGADLRHTDLTNADLRNAVLIGADLRDVTLRRTDLLGTDLRAADLRGADLRPALYLTNYQVGSARGDATTRLPASLDTPLHWR